VREHPGAKLLPPGELLPIHVIARALNCNRSVLFNHIDSGELIAYDVRNAGSSRFCIRIERQSLLEWIKKRQGTIGKHVGKRERISPTKWRRHPRPAAALLAILRSS